MRHPDEIEDKINYKATFKLVFSLMKPHKLKFIAAFAYLIISTSINLANPIIIKYILDTAIPTKNKYALLLAILFYFINTVLFLTVNYLLAMKLIIAGQKIITELKNKMVKHLLNLDMSYYSENPVGRLTARVESDTQALYELFTETAVTIFKDIFMLGAIFTIMAFFNLKLTMILLPVFPVVFLFVWRFGKKTSPMFVKVRKINAEISAFVTEHLNGISVVQAFGQEKFISKKSDEINAKKFNMEIKAERLAVLFFTTILLLQPFSIAGVFGFGGIWFIKKEITIGILVMFILYLDKLFEPIFRFSEHISIIQKSFSAGHRIFEILKVKQGILDIERPRYISGVKKSIEFKNVWMRYDDDSRLCSSAPAFGGTMRIERPNWVLKNVSFELIKGKSLAIVGETGGGKTTITNLLFRFYTPQKGKILIDDMDINDISMESVRSALGLVQQDMYLFPGAIMDNLKLMDKSVPDSKVYDAIDKIKLKDFFKKHSLNKKVVEKGANLSIGEKQVIALTRAMVLDQEILVLDEATSHMDPYTEKIVTNAIKNLSKHKTLIIIAHRLSTIKNADNILLLSDGEIKEAGNHENLIKAKGLYSKFYESQFGEN
ncbi:MAG: ABC transporter ATP-binding protein/permease [Elusimicrobia bacterium]|nr:ABC transporter ATP-binding protein/permease [Elusimicrobiota bacterium]